MNGQTNKNALVGECVKNMKGSWRSARDLRTSHFDVHRDNAKRYDAVGYREKCISTRYVALPSSFLFPYPFVPWSNVYTNVRAPYVPVTPLLRVLARRVLLIGVQPTDRPVVGSFVRSR